MFVRIFIPRYLTSTSTYNPINKPFSGDKDDQIIPQSPDFVAGFAGYITLGLGDQMTCQVCNHINELSAIRCINCSNLLSDGSFKTKEIRAEEKKSPLDIALKDIKNAWLAGVISGVLTLVFTLLAMSGVKILSFDVFALIDTAIVFGLTFGIYKKNRVCAVLMLIYFLFAKFMLFLESGRLTGLPLALVLIYYYYKGILGTFNFHKLVTKNTNA